ncbi:hypothetical protein Tco_0650412 [Tanacetum coccineum]
MVINPPWNLPFIGAKGLTSPVQTATVEMVFSRPWTCTFLVAKGLTTPELMANCSNGRHLKKLEIQVKIKLGEDCWEIYCKRLNTGSITIQNQGPTPTTIPDTTLVITPPTTQTDTTMIPTKTPIIAPTIPPSPDYTPASPDYSPASDSESDPSEDPSSDHIPPLPAISPFLSSADDTTDSDTPDTPPSPTHVTPFTEITSSTQRSPVIPCRRVMILAPGQPIPHGRPYRYHLNGPVHKMTARKRVGSLPVQQLAVRHSVDHSSSDYFSPDDSARDSSSDSSSEASSDFHSDASSDSSLRHSLPDHSFADLPSTSTGPSRKRLRSPMIFVPVLPLVSGALPPVHADLRPSPKRVRDSGYLADVEVDPRETSLRDDVIVRGSDEPHLEQDIDTEIQAEIDECFAYADALRDRGIDARVVVKAVDREENRGIDARVVVETVARYDVETGTRDLIVVSDDGDTPPVVPKVIEGVQREQGHRIIGVESAVTALTKRIAELERDNWRLRDTASVESQRVDRLQRGISRMKMPNTRSGASITHEEVEELVTRRVAEEMEAREAAMNLEPLNENGDEQEGGNRGNGNGGNRGNGNEGNGENRNGGNGGDRNGETIPGMCLVGVREMQSRILVFSCLLGATISASSTLQLVVVFVEPMVGLGFFQLRSTALVVFFEPMVGLGIASLSIAHVGVGKGGYPMIERIQGQRSNPRVACEEDLEASSPAINRRLLSLTKEASRSSLNIA